MRDVVTTRQPLRVIVDSKLETPLDAKILQGGPVLIAAAVNLENRAKLLMDAGAEVIVLPNSQGNVELRHLLVALAQRGINEVQVEAGPALCGALLRAGRVDELLLYQAPLLLGDSARPLFAGLGISFCPRPAGRSGWV